MSSNSTPAQQTGSKVATVSLETPSTSWNEAEQRRKSPRVEPRHVLILGGLSALGALATDMYLPALPALSLDLGASMAEIQWTLSAGILGVALGQVIAGPLSDRLGRLQPLLGGLAAFTLTSLLCVIAPSVGVLTWLRFLQGLAGAAGIVIALAVVSDRYTGITQARLFATLAQISGLAPIIAPVIGSQLLTFASWHGIFIALALIGVILFLSTLWGLGESLPVERRQRGGMAVTGQTFGGLLSDRRFVGYALSSGFAVAAAIVYISFSPFVLQQLYGFTPQSLGLVMGVNALGLVLMAQLSSRLVGRITPQTLLMWGVMANAIAGISLLVVVLSGVGLFGILASLFLLVASLGLIVPNATTLALSNTQTAGSASALLGVLQLTIGAVAAPLIGLAGATSAAPMAIAIAGFGIATVVTFGALCQPAR